MTSLLLLSYLDKTLILLRPAFVNSQFGGLPLLLTGEAFQLPVASSLGPLSKEASVSYKPELLTVYRHCTKGVFFLELSEML